MCSKKDLLQVHLVSLVRLVVWLIRHDDGCVRDRSRGRIDGSDCSANRCLNLKKLLDLEAGVRNEGQF